MRLKEWFAWHFPELTKIVNDNTIYAKLVYLLDANRENVTDEMKERIEEITKDEEKANQIIEAAKIYSLSNPDTYFLVIGSGPQDYTLELINSAKKARVNNLFLWVPASEKIEQYYSAMDIYTSTSIYGEGFSNTIGEAMSCSLPCVVTNVGDSSVIVGNTGIIIEPYDIEEIVRGWKKIGIDLKNNGNLRFTEQRKRICENFSIEKMTINTEKIILNTIQIAT